MHMKKRKKEIASEVDLKQIGLWTAGLIIFSLLGGVILKTNVFLPIDAFFYTLIRNIPHTDFLNTLVWPFDHNFLPFLHPHPSYLILMEGIFLLLLLIFKRSQFISGLLS